MSGDVAAAERAVRPALDGAAVAAVVVRDGGLWREVRVVAETGSTNRDIAAAAAAGAPEGLVLVAEAQTAGRGRFDRAWVSPPRAGLTFSALLRPGPAVAMPQWSWLPLLAGLAVHRAVTGLAGVAGALKWPNDLLLGPARGKAGGLLVQATGDAAVLGVGLNVSTTAAELPEGATSLAVEGAAGTDRGRLMVAILDQLADDYLAWRAAGGVGGSAVGQRLRAAYLEVCDTLGRRVRVTLPDGSVLDGVADTLDDAGRLVLRTPDGDRAVSAGDVRYVRPAPERDAGR